MSTGRSALFLFVILLAMPGFVFAKDMQADKQCPPGGTVGQKCTDSTNGYVTQGTCTHINVCKAVSWNTNPPKGCGSSGNIYAPTGDCPKGPQISSGGSIRPSTTTTPITVDANSPIRSNIFDQAFSDISTPENSSDNFVSTTSLNGIEYIISGGEALEAGAPLTEEPEEVVPPSRVTLALGSVYGLSPVRAEGVSVQSDSNVLQSYTPAIGTFTSNGSMGYAPPVDFTGQVVRLSGQMVGSFKQFIGHLFANDTSVEQEFSHEPPPLSLYAQVHWTPTTFAGPRDLSRTDGFVDQVFEVFKAIGKFIETHVFPAFPR